MELATRQRIFDYNTLEESKRSFIQEKTKAIKIHIKRTAKDIIAVGQDLLAVKQELEHGQFKAWLQLEFDMSYDTAINFMQVARRFGGTAEVKNGKFPLLPPSVLYYLASPKMPEQVVCDVLSGNIQPTREAIKEAKKVEQEKHNTTDKTRKLAGIPALIPSGTPPEEEVRRKAIEKTAIALNYKAQELLGHLQSVHQDTIRGSAGITATLEAVRRTLIEATTIVDDMLQHNLPSEEQKAPELV